MTPGYEEEALGKAYDARLMRRLLRYLRPYWAQVAGALVLLMLGAALALAPPYLVKVALDGPITRSEPQGLLPLAQIYVAVAAVVFFLQYGQALVTTWLGQRVMYDIRKEVFGHLQKLDLRYFDRRPVGRSMTRITSDVETLNELFGSGLVSVFGDIFTLVFIVAVMLQMNAELALVTFSAIPFVILAAAILRTRIRRAFRDIRARLARLNAFLQERFTGIRIVQLFNRQAPDHREFRRLDREYLAAHLRSVTYYALFFPLVQLFTSVAMALIVWYGGGQFLQGAVEVGVLAAFIEYARRFFRPIQDLSDKYNLLQGAMASSERIFKVLDTKPAILDPPKPRSFPKRAPGEIRFEGVWFAYDEPDGKAPHWVIRDLSFVVPAGGKVAIVGHTGAGKSTVISLLMRFYEPQRGTISVDGVPIQELSLKTLRDRIGLVLQDVFLFGRSIAYNVRLGNDDIDDSAIAKAVEDVGAASIVSRSEGGMDAILGERGSTLSVGERQLLSFARVLAFDPDILVLDEATSSVDSKMEAKIERATDRALAGRTSMVIAHRLSTVRSADEILVLHQGKAVERGSHELLIAAGGVYRRLHQLQFSGAQSRSA